MPLPSSLVGSFFFFVVIVVVLFQHNFKIVSMPKEKLLLIGITLSLSRKNEFISFLNFALENQCDQICQNFANFAKIKKVLGNIWKDYFVFGNILKLFGKTLTYYVIGHISIVTNDRILIFFAKPSHCSSRDLRFYSRAKEKLFRILFYFFISKAVIKILAPKSFFFLLFYLQTFAIHLWPFVRPSPPSHYQMMNFNDFVNRNIFSNFVWLVFSVC